MNGLPPDFSGSMNGRMLSHSMYDRNSAPAPSNATAAAEAAGPALADVLLNARRYSAGDVATMDPLILQQEIVRRNSGIAAAAAQAYGAPAAVAPQDHAAAATLARQEEELVRLHDEHNRIMEAELAARAMRDRVAAAQAAQDRADSFRADSIDRIVALQEQQAVRQREIDRLKQAQLTEQSYRLLHHQNAETQLPTAAARGDLFLSAGQMPMSAGSGDVFLDAASYGARSHLTAGEMTAGSPNLAEELAFRGRMQRQLLEEEAIKAQRQATLNSHQAALKSRQAMIDFAGATRDAVASAERERQHQEQQQAAVTAERERQHQQQAVATVERERQQQELAAAVVEREMQQDQQRRSSHHSMNNSQHSITTTQGQAMLNNSNHHAMNSSHHSLNTSKHTLSALNNSSHLSMNNSQHSMTGVAGSLDAAAAPSEREHLARLLQLQQMPDEDLLRRASDFRHAQTATLQHSLEQSKLEQQLREAKLLRSGLQRFQGTGGSDVATGDPRQQSLDMIDQAHADAAIARQFSSASEKQSLTGGRASSSQQQQNKPQPLRYFNNGVEVDMDGNPLQQPNSPGSNLNNNSSTPATAPVENSVEVNRSSVPPPSSDSVSTLDNNIIAKFLTVVVSRVPEIAPSVANLLPDGGDPVMLKREFPHVVDATLAELKSIKDRFAGVSEHNSSDLHQRVTNCIAAIEPYKLDLSAAGGMVPLPQIALGGPRMPLGVPPSAMAAGIMRQALLEPRAHLDKVSPLMPDSAKLLTASEGAAGTVASGSSYLSAPGELTQQAGALKSNSSQTQLSSPIKKKEATNPDSPTDDLTLRAAYNSHKKDAKQEKRESKRRRSSSKKNRPKLVHSSPTVSSPSATIETFDVSELGSKGAGTTASDYTFELNPSTESTSQKVIKKERSMSDSEKSVPMKKRRVSDQAKISAALRVAQQAKINDADDSIHPVGRSVRRNMAEISEAPGPHGELLNQLFGEEKPSVVADDGAKDKPSVEGGKKRGPKSRKTPSSRAARARTAADAESAVITDVSGHTLDDQNADKSGRRRSTDGEDEGDGHYDAASVLLGLMGRKQK